MSPPAEERPLDDAGVAVAGEPVLLNTLRAHKNQINSIAFAADGQKLISGSDDGVVVFWNLLGQRDGETGLCYRLLGHKGAVNSVDFADDDRLFVSAGQDSHVRLWRLNSGGSKPNEEPVVYKCHAVNVRHVSLNPGATRFCTASDDKTVKLWDANHRNKFITSLLGHSNWVRCSRFCPTQSHLIASCGDDCMLLVHDTRTAVRSPPAHAISGSKSKHHSYSHFTSLDWFPLSDFLIAVGSSDSSLRIYDLRQGQTGSCVQYYEAHNGPINSVAFHCGGEQLISASSDNLLKVYDVLEGRVQYTIKAHTGPVKCVRYTRDGQHFASAGNDRTIYLWQSSDGLRNSSHQTTDPEPSFSMPLHHVGRDLGRDDSPMRSSPAATATTTSYPRPTPPPSRSPLPPPPPLPQAAPDTALDGSIMRTLSALTNAVSLLERRVAAIEERLAI